MKRSKNILFLLLLLAMIAAVTFPSFIQFKIFLVKHDANERLEKAHLQIIYVAAKDIRWTQKGKEIKVGDRLFDVKQYAPGINGFVLTGIYDDDESILNKQLDEAWHQQHSKDAIILLKYFDFLGINHPNEPFFKAEWLSKTARLYATQTNFYNKDIFLKIPYPPPQQNNHVSFT